MKDQRGHADRADRTGDESSAYQYKVGPATGDVVVRLAHLAEVPEACLRVRSFVRTGTVPYQYKGLYVRSSIRHIIIIFSFSLRVTLPTDLFLRVLPRSIQNLSLSTKMTSKIESSGPALRGGNIDLAKIIAPTDVSTRQTKIVCTLGPACWSQEMLETLIDTGLSIARFNFSHGDHETHAATLERLRAAAEKKGKHVGKFVHLFDCLFV